MAWQGVPPPQAEMPAMNATRSSNMPSIDSQRRRRAEIPNKNAQARTAPLPAYQGSARGVWLVEVHCPGALAVVVRVRVAEPGVAPVTMTGVVVPKLKV